MRETFETAIEEGRMEMARFFAKRLFEVRVDLKSVQIMCREDLSQDEIMQILETTQHGIDNPDGRKRTATTKKVEMRRFRH